LKYCLDIKEIGTCNLYFVLKIQIVLLNKLSEVFAESIDLIHLNVVGGIRNPTSCPAGHIERVYIGCQAAG